MEKYDVIVIGAGHAGIEAALASARMGSRTLLVTMNKGTIGHMSCNPAIGGVGKGQLVKEIDALGGEMARAADACGIQFRVLNASKGPAVQSSRAQIDRALYKAYMQKVTAAQKGLEIREAEVKRFIVEADCVTGVVLANGQEIYAGSVVFSPGTFLDGLIHVGLKHHEGGRIDEPASAGLAEDLRARGFCLLRFKTGTCARLDKDSIDFSKLIVQEGDDPPRPFSFSTKAIRQAQVPCYITYTNENTHQIIRDNLDRSPLYAGLIQATGVRYCPSIEDKVVKFAERPRHQIFLEPEGLSVKDIYPNGLSTSLPEDVQLKMIHSVEGLEQARVLVFGYGIEHTVVEPTQLFPTLETKLLKGLFLAGQINGTTGYEEAAAQGLVAGINASLSAQKRGSVVLDRATSYIGVLIDDLTTKGTAEPYRMFTSRVEYRLILREDNADLRLARIGFDVGLVSAGDYKRTQDKEKDIKEAMKFFAAHRIKPQPRINQTLENLGLTPLTRPVTLEELLKRPGASYREVLRFAPEEAQFADSSLLQAEIEIKYSGFIQRQLADVARFRNLEKIRLPEALDYRNIPGLSCEIREKLTTIRPINLGQAARISGVTPAAVSLLAVYLKKLNG